MNPTNDPHDDELRGLLRALRSDGERKAPSFAQTWRAAKARQHPVGLPSRLAWAVATAAAVVLVILIILPRQPKSSPVATTHREPPTLKPLDHQAAPLAVVPGVAGEALPTDFLLTTNNDDSVARVASQIDALLRP